MNPYAAQLGQQDPLAVIESTPGELAKLVEVLGSGGLKKSLGPGKWNAREILCHLADTEIAFAFRLRQALAETHHVIQPFDQDAWARSYASCEARVALEAFAGLRRWNVGLIRNLPSETMSKTLTHPERGAMTFRVLVETMAGHDLNHLGQLKTIAARAVSE
jgi:hypothetical protein